MSARNPDDLPHRLFARLYVHVLTAGESEEVRRRRRGLVEGLRGRVLEVGAGGGANFAFYPDTVAEVIAVEPEPYLRRRAESAARQAPVAVRVLPGRAEALPLADASVDAIVASLVLCSVPSQSAALAEARRVLRPGGELRVFEHVAYRQPALRGLQRALDATFWPRAFGGCHTARDTRRAIEDAGFSFTSCQRIPVRGSALEPPVPHILGIARVTA